MFRWHRLLENMPDSDYVFLSDADMRFESEVGAEILSQHVTLTMHTVCGLDAGGMKREERPVTWAGIWCTTPLHWSAISGVSWTWAWPEGGFTGYVLDGIWGIATQSVGQTIDSYRFIKWAADEIKKRGVVFIP